MEAPEKKSPIPPYVAYKTFSAFLERFSQGVPGRIDRGLMGSMSGAAQSQVTTALRYLGFISENGIPTESMKRYVSGEENSRKQALREVLSVSYPFIFGNEAAFDFSTATSSQLKEAFEENTAATGETVGRCIAFLKDAASDAGIAISPYIFKKHARASGSRKRVVGKKKEEAKPADQEPQQGTASFAEPIAARDSMLLWGLFKRLPKPGSVWTTDDRDHWIRTLQNVLLLEYREQ